MHKAKKSLGQNFLKSKGALSAIVRAGEISKKDIILEIGPGLGALTSLLLDTGAQVVAIEKDKDLIPILKDKFVDYINNDKFVLTESDVLEFNPEESDLISGRYKLIANIPYYITGAILRKFTEGEILPSLMVLLVQKEVATRIVARDGKESILSVSVKAFGDPKIVVKVPNTAFSPIPKVDSAVLSITNISQNRFLGWKIEKNKAIKGFFEILHFGFAHKRKLLTRNLETLFKNEQIAEAFLNLNFDKNTRAEDLNINQWFLLAQKLLDK